MTGRITLLFMLIFGLGQFVSAQTGSSVPVADSASNVRVVQADTLVKPKAAPRSGVRHSNPSAVVKPTEDAEDSDFQIKHPSLRLKLGGQPETINGKPVHSSRRAWMLSTALPGSGQIYNHRYWKLPIVYGGLAGLIATVVVETKYYNTTLQYYKILLVNPTSTAVPAVYVASGVTYIGSVKDYYRRNRDLAVIGVAVLWLANAVDAYVDSELKGFDVSNSLSFRVKPYIGPSGAGQAINSTGMGQPAYGLKLVMSFK